MNSNAAAVFCSMWCGHVFAFIVLFCVTILIGLKLSWRQQQIGAHKMLHLHHALRASASLVGISGVHNDEPPVKAAGGKASHRNGIKKQTLFFHSS